MTRWIRRAGWLLFAAASTAARAQQPAAEAHREFYVEIAPDASSDAIARARLTAGVRDAREIAGSSAQLWRVPAGRFSDALRQARTAPGIRTVDVAGGDYRHLFVQVEDEARLTQAQRDVLQMLKDDAGFDTPLLGRLRANGLGLMPLRTGFDEREGLPVAASFLIELEPGFQLVATRRSPRPGAEIARWSGDLLDPGSGASAGIVSFVVDGRNISGIISTARGNYSVNPLGEGIHAISRVGLPPSSESDAPDKVRPPAPAVAIRGPKLTDLLTGAQSIIGTSAPIGAGTEAMVVIALDEPLPASVIRIAVAYTAAAAKRMQAQGAPTPAAPIESAVEAANRSFAASQIRVTLKLSEIREAVDPELGVAELDLNALLNRKDRRYDELPGWRRQLGANAVMLIVGNSNRCGLAPTTIPVTASQAYAVILQSCLADLVLPHELGHLLGARHHDDKNNNPFPYGRGYVSGSKFQTIMGNSRLLNHAAIWAGPDIRLDGMITGNSERNNDARVINDQAPAFSRFREE